jgi:flagellar biosynthesis protein FlhF
MEVDVKIKRYMAASMRAALDQVRIEQGPDAVILSSRRVNEGVEVIAAVDYDEALIASAARRYSLVMAAAAAQTVAGTMQPIVAAAEPVAHRQTPVPPTQPVSRTLGREATAPRETTAPREEAAPRAAAPRAATVPGATAPRATSAPSAAASRATAAPPRPAPSDPAGMASMEREIKGLRALLETELANLSWHDRRQREPLKARVLEDLSAMDIAPDVAATLASRTPSRTNLDDTSKIPLALLLRHLPVVDDLSTVNAGVHAIVGPTGAGKTTTIAKLAARWTMKHGSEGLALVSTDSYRIGAREQLMTYARVLGASMHAPNSGAELARVLERLKSKRLVLIDTAGMGPRDVRLPEQIEALKQGAAHAKFMLALPAPCEGRALEEIIRAFSPLTPSSCILTKVDEAGSLGAVISTAVRHRLKIAYLCNGQRVPEDLHSAHRHRVWLVRAAHQLREKSPSRHDAAYHARHFGRGQIHA